MHFDSARLVRILSIFDPIELIDDDLIYDPTAGQDADAIPDPDVNDSSDTSIPTIGKSHGSLSSLAEQFFGNSKLPRQSSL